MVGSCACGFAGLLSVRPLLLGLVLIVFIRLDCSAQLTQPARFELVHESGDQGFSTVSLEENGIALIREKKMDGNKRPWEIIVLDSTLQQSWTAQVHLESRLKLIGYEYNSAELYYLFRQSESEYSDLYLVRVFLYSRQIQEYTISPKLEFRLTHFIVSGNSAIFGGYVSRQSSVILFDMNSVHLKVLPGFFIENTELLELKANRNATFNALLVERGNRDKKRLILKTYDASGSLLVEDDIDIDDNKTILAGTTSTLAHDELLLTGVWGTGGNNSNSSNKQAGGLFSVLADPFNKQEMRYSDFAELNHFMDYMPSRKVLRIKGNAERRRKAGKSPSFKVNVHVVRMEETAKGFALLCELYIPTVTNNYPFYSPYGSPYYSPGYNPYYNPYAGISPYGYNPMMANRYYNSPYNPYGSNGRSTDVTMLHSALIVFDQQGKVKEDFGISLEELKLPALEQTSDFYAAEKFTQFYKKETSVHVISNWEDGNAGEQDTVKIQLKFSKDIVRNESNDQGGIRYWYGRYCYVWGYETIKNRVDQVGDPVRYVYYVNKIRLD